MMTASAKALEREVVTRRSKPRVMSWLRMWQQVILAELLLLLESLNPRIRVR